MARPFCFFTLKGHKSRETRLNMLNLRRFSLAKGQGGDYSSPTSQVGFGPLREKSSKVRRLRAISDIPAEA